MMSYFVSELITDTGKSHATSANSNAGKPVILYVAVEIN